MFSFRPGVWLFAAVATLGNISAAVEKDRAKADKAASPAQALVLAALDQEAAGDPEGRRQLLQEALAADPDYPPARWHAGQVRLGSEWLSVKAAMEQAAADETLREYRSLRDKAEGNPAMELDLAQWCTKHQMPDRARLHHWRVLTHPKATEKQIASAAKQLDLVSVGGMILTRDELKQEQAREKRIANAIEKWRPVLAELQPAIDGGFDQKHDKAVERLAAIDDPAVIPAVETFLQQHREDFGEELVKLLATFPHYESTQTLVRYAVVSPYLSVRERSIAALKQRPLHDYVPTLLAGLVTPIEAQYHFERDRNDDIRFRRQFVQEWPQATLVAQVEQFFFNQPLRGGGPVLKGICLDVMRAKLEALLASEVATTVEQLEFEAYLSRTTSNHANQRVFELLEQVTEHQPKRQPQAWWDWWKEYNQLHYPKSTYYAVSYSRHEYVGGVVPQASCFEAGTLVWTETQLNPIESIQPGDRVLSQDPDSGDLCFKVVLAKTLRPPTEASQLTVNGESITTTLGHPLWLTGTGWEMAKNIKPGDQLHGVHGIVNVNAVEPLGNKVEAHNLVVEDFNTYFVGNCGMLVHDNTYRQPTRAVVPGLTPP
jgi:hypothetical protein